MSKSSARLVLAGLMTSLAMATAFTACSTSAVREPSSTKITGNYASKRVVQSCVILTHLPDDQDALCSSVLVDPEHILTAAHCNIIPQKTSIICSCGEDDHQKSVEYSVEAEALKHPDFGPNYLTQMSVDVQLVKFGSKMRNGCTGSGVPPMSIAKDLAEAQSLIQPGKCFIAGWGIDMSMSGGSLHAAEIPRGTRISSYTFTNSKVMKADAEMKTLQLFNDAYRSRLVADMAREKNDAAAAGMNKRDLKALDDRQNAEYDATMALISGDRNRHNSIRQGDSGGPLFCTDSKGVDQLIGIIHSERQEIVLINSPLIQTWIESELKKK